MNEDLHALLEDARACSLDVRAVLPLESLDPVVLARVDAWLADGRAGCMDYLHRQRPLMANPRHWKSWAQSAVLFALPYARPEGGFRAGGKVARYALGADYHNRIGRLLQKLGRRLRARGACQAFRACTDAAPLLEREWAIRSGHGWRGKNTLLLDPVHGPWVLLGELLLDCPLPAWTATRWRTAHCGNCTACLDACPTQALTEPYRLDARRCLSYLSIEQPGPIPRPLRPQLGSWVFGCDVCLEVCPFGHQAGDHAEDWGLHEALNSLDLASLLRLPDSDFDQVFAGSPLRRAGWEGLSRTACVVLGNLGRGSTVLQETLHGHPSALVRGHAAWALGRLGRQGALRRALTTEGDPTVRAEIEAALVEAGPHK